MPRERRTNRCEAVERRERQNVDEREVGREDAHHVERDDRPLITEGVAERGGDADESPAGESRWRWKGAGVSTAGISAAGRKSGSERE